MIQRPDGAVCVCGSLCDGGSDLIRVLTTLAPQPRLEVPVSEAAAVAVIRNGLETLQLVLSAGWGWGLVRALRKVSVTPFSHR